MKIQLAILAPAFTLFVASIDVVNAKTSATTCVSNCFSVAAASVGCATSDVACVKDVRAAFQDNVQQCLEANACTSLPEGTQAELNAASDTIALRGALVPEAEYDGMLEDEDATILARVVPRSSLTERATLTARGATLLPVDAGTALRVSALVFWD
ncbi:hypothetical protein NMY22_g1043 [Coprinellus aureogranulatus]|nr:hypothetical protein NMY22_g1043 [Coprinellus aureogranulatus]